MLEKPQYSPIAKILHWLVAGLIVAQYLLAELSEYAEAGGKVVQQLALLANHKSVGMTVLFLAVLRVVWRLFNKPPALPTSMTVWQQRASHTAHWAIYVLIFALPLSGWLMSSANAYSVSWFNLFVFPDLVAADKSLAAILHDVHEIIGKVLLVLVVVHIAAALKHHFIDKDGVLQRMTSLFGWVMFVLTLVLVVGVFGRFIGSSANSVEASPGNLEASKVTSDASNTITPLSDLPIWKIDYQQSYIQFTADQAGAPFDGRWTDWQAVMQFDATRLADSAFNVTINTEGVNSSDEERDGYIVGSDFFDVVNFKTATFTANEFNDMGSDKFTSPSHLSIKGLSKPLLFTFNVRVVGDKVELNGSASLDRFAWNVGTGDWSDPTWVGQDVIVNVRVVATIEE